MAKSYQAIKGRSPAKFVMLRYDIMDSPAWKSLNPNAWAIWCLLARRHNGYNNGEIPLSCREVSDALHISKDTANKGFDALIRAGFAIVTEDAAFNMKQRKSRRWALTHIPIGNNAPTNEWREKSKNGQISGTP